METASNSLHTGKQSTPVNIPDRRLLTAVIETLADIAAIDLEPQAVMQAITERTCAFAGADGASLELIREDKFICQAVTGITGPYQGTVFPTEGTLSGLAVREGKALCCDDSESDTRVDRNGCRVVGARSLVVVPLPHNGRIVGTLKVLSKTPNAFNLDHVDGLKLMAGLLAAAMNTAAEFEAKKALLCERTRALAALRESEERFRSAFEYAAIGKAMVALDGRWMQVNRSLCSIVGYTEAELLATNFQSITHPEDLNADLEFVRQLTAGEIPHYQMTKRYFHKSGRIVWVLLSVSLIRDEANRPLYFISQIQDITDGMRAQRLEADHRNVLEMVAQERPVKQVINRLIQMVQDHLTGACACFMLIEEGQVSVIGPTLPQAVLQTITARPVSAAAELCGNVEPGRRPKCHDLVMEGLNENVRRAALAHNLRGCWAFPIDAADGVPLGVLAVFTRDAAPADTYTKELCDSISRMASLAMHRQLMADQLARRAHHDPLTGLPNRSLFTDRLDHALASAARNGTACALLVLDIDRFKSINDTHGHDVGDQLLQQFAHRVGTLLRESDTLARIGGDEFSLILPNLKNRDDAITVARKIVEAFKEPFLVTSGPLPATCSIGVSLYPADAKDAGALQKVADTALYKVKARGRNGYEAGPL
jgi:diguanylate cyclase (GGDEF)-like protein/PAS domain S-box-containing protein